MIIYASVARVRDGTILVEVTDRDVKGNIGQVMVTFLQHLKDHTELIEDGQRKTFYQQNESELDFFSHFIEACSVALQNDGTGNNNDGDEHYFHIYRKDDVFYCCLGDDPDPRDQKVNFAFLEHLQGEFIKMYRPWRINNANAYAFQKNFSPSLRSGMHYHNINHTKLSRDANVQKLLPQVENLKSVMGRNINILIENQQNVDSLISMSIDMQQDAKVFKRRTRAIAAKTSRRNYFNVCLGFFVVLVLLYMFVMSICGPTLAQCYAPSSSSDNDSDSSSANADYDDDGGGDENGDGGGRW